MGKCVCTRNMPVRCHTRVLVRGGPEKAFFFLFRIVLRILFEFIKMYAKRVRKPIWICTQRKRL